LRDALAARNWSFVDDTLVLAMLDTMIRKIQLGGVKVALEEAQRALPQYDLRSVGAQQEVINALMAEGGLDPCSLQDVTKIAKHLGAANRISLSDFGRRQRQDRAAQTQLATEITRLRLNITKGQDLFVMPRGFLQKKYFGSDYGKARNVQSSFLDNLDVDALREIEAAVRAYRVARDGHAEPTAAPEAPAEGVVASVQAQKHTAEPTDEFLAHPDHPEREYTRKELMTLDRRAYSNLLFMGGQSRGVARRNAIERILRNQPFQG
jgi:hypothetical protein